MDDKAFTKQLGIRIRDARREAKISQTDLAFRIGKTQTAISGYENGARVVHLLDLIRLAEELRVSIAYLVGESDLPYKRRFHSRQTKIFTSLALEGNEQEPLENAYNLFIEAYTIKQKISRDDTQKELSIDTFLTRIFALDARYKNDEFSLNTFASLLGIDVFPLQDILLHLKYVPRHKSA